MITVHGGVHLHGTVAVEGSKNASLPLLAAAACVNRSVTVVGLPGSADVLNMLKLMKSAGIALTLTGAGATIDQVREEAGDLSLAATIRASYYIVPALLGVHGRARLPWPGGCSIGVRSMDQHFAVYDAFGDLVTQDEEGYEVTAGGRHGPVYIKLPFPSRGATIAAILRAVVSRRVLMLVNPNRSPETVSVLEGLRCCGVQVEVRENDLSVVPAGLHTFGTWCVPGDKVEAATLLCAIAITRGSGTVTGAASAHLAAFAGAMGSLGFTVDLQEDAAHLDASHQGRPAKLSAIATLDPDGLDADFEPALLVTALGVSGTHRFGDSINPGRHGNLLPELRRFGARIRELSSTLCEVTGPQQLHPTDATAADIRTGSATVLAALAAEGESHITNTAQIRRGHPDLVGLLTALGAKAWEDR